MLTTLGNFLSGMETASFVPSTAPSLSLGNFLSGMETTDFAAAVGGVFAPWKLP